MNVVILGSGFGLYGYLPAFVSCGYNVLMPKRYREKFQSRSELHSLSDSIYWKDDDETALSLADVVAVAKPPEYQEKLIPDILKHSNIRTLFLEKPLAVTPSSAKKFFKLLLDSGVNFLINYIFFYEDWLEKIKRSLTQHSEGSYELCIEWFFMANHFKNNVHTWKRFHSKGGGALRFYAIHFIALMAYLGFCSVETAKLTYDDSCFNAVFKRGENRISLSVDSKNENSVFFIKEGEKSIFESEDPFSLHSNFPFDRRVVLIRKHILSLKKPFDYDIYKNSILLWEEVEKKLSRY